MSKIDSSAKIEFGDFQTPPELAQLICQRLAQTIHSPQTIIEPTCGKGNMLLAAIDAFPQYTATIGIDINETYVHQLQQTVSTRQDQSKIRLLNQDFFQTHWSTVLSHLPDPLLIIGNPPWVTNAGLSTIDSANLPQKSNFHGFSGLDAMTGKSNFDISEWMLIHLLEQLNGRASTLAMLCKTAVARRVLTFAWQNNIALARASLYSINSKHHFNAAVDACLLICSLCTTHSAPQPTHACDVYDNLSVTTPSTTFGYVDGQLIANLPAYNKWHHLLGKSSYQWRSGIKHDCAKVMELTSKENGYTNGLGESVELEKTHIYGLLKSSDLAKAARPTPRRHMIVPQASVGQATAQLRVTAPLTWHYLSQHSEWFDRRKSAIYKKQPRFAIFGVGPYSFAPWKVAIAGLYKTVQFAVVAPYQDKPVMLDDTCYFIPCTTEAEAKFLAELLNSEIAKQFFQAFIFWDSKRPITASLLNQVDLSQLAHEMNYAEEFSRICNPVGKLQTNPSTPEVQLSLFS